METTSGRNVMARFARSDYVLLYVYLILFAALGPIVPGLFSTRNLANLLGDLWPLLLASIGQTFVLIGGGIDLSMTATIALSSVAGGMVMSGNHGLLSGSAWAVPCGLAAMLLCGVIVGTFNGIAVAYAGLPPFMVTLITMMLFGGASVWVTRSKNLSQLPESFTHIAESSQLVAPGAVIIAIFVILVAYVGLERSVQGFWIYAAGRNARAALISGIPVKKTIFATYVISGVCATAASILYTSHLQTASPAMGKHVLLDVIAAAVIGGTSLFGGKGKIGLTAVGAIFVSLLDNSLNLLGFSNFAVLIAKGCVILFAAVADAVTVRLRAQT
jgi:ribose/xylose/arabinose/galactoside ABC-type transport system permease subunit